MSHSLRCVRRVIASTQANARHASSFSSSSSSPSASATKKSYFLTPEKKRALISLYHQSDTFITPENLSSRIDEAFIKKEKDILSHQVTSRDLNMLVEEKRRAPKFREWNREKRGTTGGNWSAQTTHREWKVIEALYGVDASDRHNAMPGLEALEEFEEEDLARRSQRRQSPHAQSDREVNAIVALETTDFFYMACKSTPSLSLYTL
ncbi:hypothetical protein VNI00_001084 [Paramarasmius palmivorus]|uniref:Neugrin n=1 Tax=Paramarasmius palmivorus TaxID=297713 RepID=A0AAW0E8E6_9AGAR